MARAVTDPELTKLRSSGQRSQLYLAIHKPAVVFACQVNQTFPSPDEVHQVTYDGVIVGSFINALRGMTCYVGSSPGAYDLGMVRIRKAPTSSTLYIGLTSEIPWADNLHLTVVDEFGLWAKHWRNPDEKTVYMDQDIAYSNQNDAFDPCPVLGPDIVLWRTGATVAFSPTAAASWVLGSTIASYSWSAPGASATTGLTTATPTLTYNAAGTYRISCAVTAANGKTSTGYRQVFVFDQAHPPVSAFTLGSCTGDLETGYTFSVTLQDQAALSDVRERSKVILFARDFYDGVEGSIGPIPGYEPIIASGWIDEEGLDLDVDPAPATFKVKGPGYWLSKLDAFPGGLKNSTTTPTDWRFTQNLTVDKALFNILHWRSTATAVMDCYLSGDARIAAGLMAAPGSLLNQLKEIGAFILASPVCDRYGRLFLQTDSQYLPQADRAILPVVQAITRVDWTERIRIPRKVAGDLAILETSGVDASHSYYAHSFGKIPARFGNIESKDGFLVADQTDLNLLTGLYLAQRNNPFPNIPLILAENNRMIDIAPRQYVTLSIAAGDTARGITWDAKRLIPRRVQLMQDPKSSALTTEIECEAETWGPPAQTVIPPKRIDENFPPPDLPDLPDFPIIPPPDTWYPPIVPDQPDPPPCGDLSGESGPFGLSFSPALLEAGGTSIAHFDCRTHGEGAYAWSKLYYAAEFFGGAFEQYHVYVLDTDDNLIAELPRDLLVSLSFTNTLPGPVDIGGFSISLEDDNVYEPYKYLASYSIDVLHAYTHDISGLNPDKVYMIGSVGSWSYNDREEGWIVYALGWGYPGTGGSGVTGGAGATGLANPDGLHSRHYLKPSAEGVIHVYFSDEPYATDNASYDWGYVLYECKKARRMTITGASIYNVCTPGM